MAENPYEGLRSLALSTDAARLGFSPTPELPDVFGVVADLALEGSVTLVCFRDGATSLYYSGGGGALGLGQHESVKQAAMEFVGSVQAALGEFSAGQDVTPLPVEHYRFTALTYGGPRTLTAAETDLRASDSGAGQIYRGFHAVVGAYRMLTEAQATDS